MYPISKYVPCPQCGCPHVNEVTFTWWGGLLGPKLLSHVKCTHCHNEYNGKSGKSNQTGILIYVAISALLVLGILAIGFLGQLG